MSTYPQWPAKAITSHGGGGGGGGGDKFRRINGATMEDLVPNESPLTLVVFLPCERATPTSANIFCKLG